jgi:phosphoadenosine phosphosulfate reductase
VRPFERALAPFEAWITGRKRSHGGERAEVPVFDAVDGRVVVSPLVHWNQADVVAFIQERDLPVHPLVFAGYLSIGCAPCTRPPVAEGDPRSGRWAGLAKTECGIHRPSSLRAAAAAEARA